MLQNLSVSLISFLSVFILLLTGCGLFNTEDEVTFENQFPNNTWYYDNNVTETYNEWAVGNLNTKIAWNNYNFPCASSDSSRMSTTIDYEIQDESTFIFKVNGGTQDTAKVKSVSKNEIIIETDSRIIDLKKNCENLIDSE